jgi:ADP-dependent NAD(P)H-hydrate dehydratase / NAD(P)H-hydrate epimerase
MNDCGRKSKILLFLWRMKLYSASTIKAWDKYTIDRVFDGDELGLMEQAALQCVNLMVEREFFTHVHIFCGPGNNGGDGLAIARLLQEQETEVNVYVFGDTDKASPAFRNNLRKAIESDVSISFFREDQPFYHTSLEFKDTEIVLDCLFGIGLNRPLEGFWANVVEEINHLSAKKIAIDLASGLLADGLEPQVGSIVEPDITYTFSLPKRAMLVRENARYVGHVEIIEIGLDPDFDSPETWHWYMLEDASLEIKARPTFAYKQQLGHLQLIAGSFGKMGAAILSATGAMRSGVGLVTSHIPKCGYTVFQSAIPEAMCTVDESEHVVKDPELGPQYTALAIGPGIGQAPETSLMLRKILREYAGPLVLDADALNLVASKELHHSLPPNTIITPHVGEFDRLFGAHENAATRIQTAIEKSKELNIIIILKGAFSMTFSQDGSVYVNASGNAGMATAGSGDVLLGIVGSFLAQGYVPQVAARLAALVHGFAGDIAAQEIGQQGLMARDFTHQLPRAIDALIRQHS